MHNLARYTVASALLSIDAYKTNAFVHPTARLQARRTDLVRQPFTPITTSTALYSMEESSSIFDAVESLSLPLNSFMVSEDPNKMFQLVKSAVIVLMFAGGLIPATIAANQSMIGLITGTRKDGDDESNRDYNPSTSLDPYIASGQKKTGYVTSSGATGPQLPLGSLLFARENIPLADIIAIIGRIGDVNSIADWKNLPSTRLEGVSATNPPLWLPRATFKENIRRAKFLSWPVDAKTGLPVGGEELEAAESKRVSQNGADIGDAALDAVYDTWAWGANVATPDKVQNELRSWRINADTFDVGKFTGSAIRGRSITGFAIVSFIILQVVAYSSLFIAPFLRVFFNVDMGFGQLGSCAEGACTTLF